MSKSTVSIFMALLMITSALFGLVLAGKSADSIEMEEITPDENIEKIEMPRSTYQHFTKNLGQWDSGFDYVGKWDLGSVGMDRDGVYFNIVKEVVDQEDEREAPVMIGHVLKLSFDDSNHLIPEGQAEIGAKYNYLIGEESDWVTHVPNFNEVVYSDVWDGIDLKYRYSNEGLKYDFILSPSSDPSDILVTVSGQGSIDITEGSLLIDVDGEVQVFDSNLEAFYLDDPSEKIDVRFSLVDSDT
ncbi:MAG: hypothetical protein ACMUHU_05580, partial [Thermoplasmatota archaeon]